MFYGLSTIDLEHLDYHVVKVSRFDGVEEFRIQRFFLIEPTLISLNVTLNPNFPEIGQITCQEDYLYVAFKYDQQSLTVKAKSIVVHESVDRLLLPPDWSTASAGSDGIVHHRHVDVGIAAPADLQRLSFDAGVFKCSGLSINQTTSASVTLQKFGFRRRDDDTLDRIFAHVNHPNWAKFSIKQGPLASNSINEIRYSERWLLISFENGGEIVLCGESVAIARVDSEFVYP
jgi:hypothetical protein